MIIFGGKKKEEFLLSEDQDSFWVIYLILDGKCQFKIGDKIGIAVGPSLLICPPNTIFERRVLESLSFHFFRLDLIGPHSYLHLESGLRNLNKERLCLNEKILRQYVYDLSAYSFFIRTHLIQDLLLFDSLNNQQPHYSQSQPTIRNSRIIELLHYIDQHYQEELTIEALSQKYCFNASYLSRLFKKELGISPKEYLLNIRLKNIQQLLISTNLPIEEIAELTGFKHGYYLSKYFKKKFGVSPSCFRKKHLI